MISSVNGACNTTKTEEKSAKIDEDELAGQKVASVGAVLQNIGQKLPQDPRVAVGVAFLSTETGQNVAKEILVPPAHEIGSLLGRSVRHIADHPCEYATIATLVAATLVGSAAAPLIATGLWTSTAAGAGVSGATAAIGVGATYGIGDRLLGVWKCPKNDKQSPQKI